MIKYKSKDKVVNWMDEIKSAQDPETLSLLYIKNLKEEIRILESQAKVLKQKLKTYNPYENKKLASSTATFADKPPQQVHIGGKVSDYAKYPTQLKLSGIFAQSNTFGSAPVKMEYIRELEALSEQLKKQNHLLQEKLNQQQHRQMSAAQPRSKYEGFDLVNSKLITSKEHSTRVFRDQKKQILQQHEQQDFTLEDRMIQNLMEEKALLEQEIQGYKKTEKNRKPIKVEGFDFMQKIKIYDKSTIIYNAKLKPMTLSKEEILEDQLVQGLLTETYLLKQQLQRLKEENQYYNPQIKQNV